MGKNYTSMTQIVKQTLNMNTPPNTHILALQMSKVSEGYQKCPSVLYFILPVATIPIRAKTAFFNDQITFFFSLKCMYPHAYFSWSSVYKIPDLEQLLLIGELSLCTSPTNY